MKRPYPRIVLLFAVAACMFCGPRALFSQESSADRERLYQEVAAEYELLQRQLTLLKKVVALVRPTVVHIDAEKEPPRSSTRRKPIEEAGSGVIAKIGDGFYVLTNRHVVHDSLLNKIRIKLADGRVINPTKMWEDAETDVAVMQIEADRLIAARFGDSRQMGMGDFVVVVGSPFGLSHSVSYGIISAKGRRDLQLGSEGVRYQDFLQTDAAINPGNSGGPMVNLRGEVIGVVTAIASNSGGNEGIGFSIPSNMVSVVAEQLVTNGEVRRAFLGVHLDSRFTADRAAALGLPDLRGARVSGITPNSPAENSELRVGDVILEFNGVKIEDDNHLVNSVSLTPLEKDVPVIVYRDRKTITIHVRVGDRSKLFNE